MIINLKHFLGYKRMPNKNYAQINIILSKIKADDILPEVSSRIKKLEETLENIAKSESYIKLDNYLNQLSSKDLTQKDQVISDIRDCVDKTLLPLELCEHDLDSIWTQISHIHSVKLDPSWEDPYEKALALVTDFYTKYSQDKRHYDLYRLLDKVDSLGKIDGDIDILTKLQKRVIKLALEDFELSGVSLPEIKKVKYQKVTQDLSLLSNDFEQNITHSTDAWSLHIKYKDKAMLGGLSDDFLDAFGQKAIKSGKGPGWLFDLHFPTYWVIMTQAKDTSLREKFYKAWVTRASDQGDFAPKWDNSNLMVNILKNRTKQAGLLDFDDYAKYVLKQRMCKTSSDILKFLKDIATKAMPVAKDQWEELKAFARTKGVVNLEPWDVLYYSEKLKQEKYGIDSESLRQYFPVDKVLDGLFDVISRLFSIKVELIDQESAPSWLKGAFYNKDVKLVHIKICDNTDAYILLDLFARDAKRGGAWMNSLVSRLRLNDKDDKDDKDDRGNGDNKIDAGRSFLSPIATITCNFQNILSGQNQARLTHDDVITLFHETGHALQHVLTKMDYLSVSGIAHVPWDAVEVCSQFLENYCWDKEVIKKLSSHAITKDPLPSNILDKMLESRNFQAAIGLMRQIQFGLFDLYLHANDIESTLHKSGSDIKSTKSIAKILADIREAYALYPVPGYDRFANSFSHIFAGGYAAGYYSYLWAEMISCDLFGRFQEEGLFNKEVANVLAQTFYQQGGAQDPNDLFFSFRGRIPKINHFLRHYGI
jgi:oligopeptidase A